MAKNTKKCEACTTADANVWFASVSGNGRVSKHRYCQECSKKMMTMRQPPQSMPQPTSGPQKSLIDLMKDSIANKGTGNTIPETPEGKIKSLNMAMKKAIDKEDYESAAKIRDEIATIQKSIKRSAT